MTERQLFPDPDVPGVLLVGAPHDRDVLGAAVAAAGARVAGAIGWDDALPDDATVALVIAAAGDLPAAMLSDRIAPLARLARITAAGAIVTLHASQIDAITPLLDTRADLLCDSDPAILAAAVALAMVRCDPRLADRVREGEAERLRRLNEEIARVVEVLARLTLDGDRGPSSVADRNRDYVGPPGTPDVTPTDIRRTIRARRLRDLHFSDGMFEDPAWDMLLDLYAAGLEGNRVSVSSLCIAAAVPPTTALRWIARMSEAGLFERQPDPGDRRRAFMGLSDLGRDKMDRYFTMLSQNGLPIV